MTKPPNMCRIPPTSTQKMQLPCRHDGWIDKDAQRAYWVTSRQVCNSRGSRFDGSTGSSGGDESREVAGPALVGA